MNANDDIEYNEVREWQILFHNLIEGIITAAQEEDSGECVSPSRVLAVVVGIGVVIMVRVPWQSFRNPEELHP